MDENKKRRLDEILVELAELHERDSHFVRHRPLASQEAIVSVPIEDLFAYGERYERRAALQEELHQMAREA
jgi:hypothetical protein